MLKQQCFACMHFVASPFNTSCVLTCVTQRLPALLATRSGASFAQAIPQLYSSSARSFGSNNSALLTESLTNMQLQNRSSVVQAARQKHVAPAVTASMSMPRKPVPCRTPAHANSLVPDSLSSTRWSTMGPLPFAASPLQHQ